ncbi:MAG: zinc dependent phospholipase C family protein [Betaproteobacteria bacterium]|nr:zinc dependent phospholipase C family protein [Betaproteobacteria bacterium]
MRQALLLATPLFLFAPDAFAWGLQTHVFFAQYALLALPFADPELRAAALRLPRLVLAGACLPDLMLAGPALGTPAFRRSHRWSTLRRLAAAPRDDAERALALGYASHLVVDVVAHNDFVPEHEARLADLPHVTHAIAEWAMDRHLEERVRERPGALLADCLPEAAAFAARAFRCDAALAARAVRLLAGADAWLRASPIPRLCRGIVQLADSRMGERFEAYLARAGESLASTEAALRGLFEDWVASDPEGEAGDRGADQRARQDVARVVQAQNHA